MDKDALILLIDDEPQILRALKTILSANHFRVVSATSGEQGLALAASQYPDVIILDLTLPDMDGIAVCEQIREWSRVPIIVLSVRDNEKDKVAALDKGADDYLTKPFGVAELIARIRAALRRSLRQAEEPVFLAGELEVDLSRRRVLVAGSEVQLTPTEYELLRLLVVHAGKVLTHGYILKHIWGTAYVEQPHVLRVNISNLRHKLEKEPSRPRHIITEPGVGYRLRADY